MRSKALVESQLDAVQRELRPLEGQLQQLQNQARLFRARYGAQIQILKNEETELRQELREIRDAD